MSLTTRFTTFVNEEKSGSLPGFNWNNLSNLIVEDNNPASYTGIYATSFGPDPTDFLVCTDIATKIPAGTVVQGITVRIKKSASFSDPDFTDAKDLTIQLVYGSSGGVATLVGNNKANTSAFWSYTFTNSTYGGISDSWGWANYSDPTYLNDSSFGIKIAATINGVNSEKNAGYIGVDYVEITFKYDNTIGLQGLGSDQQQSNVNLLTPGGVSVRPNGNNEVNPISEINRLFASYRLGGNVSNINPENLSLTHRLTAIAYIYPSSISTSVVGNHRLFSQAFIYPYGIISDQIISSVNKLKAIAYIYPSGIISAFVSGNNNLFANAYIYPNGLQTKESFSLPYLFAIKNIFPPSITSEEHASSAHRLNATANILSDGLSSEEKLGQHRLSPTANIYHQTIGSDEVVSNNHRLFAQAFIYPNGTNSQEVVGSNHKLFAQAYIYHQAPFDKFELGWSDEAHGVYLDPLAYIYVNNHNPGQPGYSPFDAPPINNIHEVSFDLFIRPPGQESQEQDNIHLLSVVKGTINPPGIDDDENVNNHQLTKDSHIYPPAITDNNSNDGLGLHELVWKRKTINFLNSIHSPAYEVGYFDLLSLTRDLNLDPQYDLAYNTIDTDYLFSVDSIKMDFGQGASVDKRYGGEGANPSTFKINRKELNLSFSMPIKVESWGYLDNSFAALYDYCIQGFKGTPTYYVGRFLSNTPSVAIGATNSFRIDNISDFATLESGSTIYVRSDANAETSEELTLNHVNRSEKTVFLNEFTSSSHTPNISYLWAKPSNVNDREPSFTMFSLREGLISGCMVDKISFTIQPGNSIIANVNLKFTDLDREYQKNILTNFNNLVSNVNKRKPNYLLSGANFRLYNTTSDAGYFNLGTPIDRKYFHGFQETDIKNFEINEITIEISNNLQPIYSTNAKSSNSKSNFEKNLLPYAYYSEGRSITGSITYSSPIKPWLFASKLSGPSSINNGGIIFDFGPFKLELPQIIWSPTSSESSMDQVHQKKVNWTAVSKTFDFNPYLLPTGVY